MKQIRKLYLQNAAGDRRDLNGKNGVYASNLAGFGVSLSPKFADLGGGFFPEISNESEPQNTLAFTITLTVKPYTAHQSLMDWLAASGSLTIVYDPTGTQEYFRDVAVSYVQKGELNQVGWLELLCSFSCKTPWYRPQPTALNITGTGQDARKRYPYTYVYRYGADTSAKIDTFIAGTGHIPGSIKLTFRGSVTNPQLRLVGNVTGKVYGTCSLSAVFDEGETLAYSSLYENSFVKRIAADGTETDLIDALDLGLSPFFHIPVTEPCTLTLTAAAPFIGRLELLIYRYYRSV